MHGTNRTPYLSCPVSPSLFNAFADVSLKKLAVNVQRVLKEKFIYSYGLVVCVVKGK